MNNSVSRNIVSITSIAALAAVEASIAHAASRGVAIVATVVDAAGHLLACRRADGAFIASIGISHDKAWTAAIFSTSTDGLCEALGHRAVLLDGIARRPGVVLFGGGLPILQAGTVIGGIGASGGSEDDDRAAAAAGLQALGLA